MKNKVISIKNYTLKKGDFTLKNINLDLEKNEISAILGKTGSGKTLLLESIAGYYKGTSGEILINGMNVQKIPTQKREIGFVYQDYCLFSYMNVESNIAYGLKMRGIKPKIINEKVKKIAEDLGISHLLKKHPRILSGGEKQRVALARALVLKPEVLLLDEPFSALDPTTKRSLYHVLLKIKKSYECSILFVTHDFNEAQKLADNVHIFIGGELKASRKKKMLFDMSENNEINEFLGLA